jgi:hypothetical protein
VTAREKQVLSDALQLTAKQRARVAAQLLASIDGEKEAGADEAWTREVERRARRVLEGRAKGADWPVVRDRLRRKTNG